MKKESMSFLRGYIMICVFLSSFVGMLSLSIDINAMGFENQHLWWLKLALWISYVSIMFGAYIIFRYAKFPKKSKLYGVL